MADEILFSLKDGVATITMNRPEKRNALNTVLLEGFNRILSHVEESKEARVVVIRGEGKAFCSGIDLRELSARQAGQQGDPETNVVQIFQRIERSRIPTIAMVHGDALAGGCELALHCDLRVAAEPARFGMPLARLGLIVPFPLGQKLVEIIGPAFTKQILLTGQPIDAKRAYEIGMVHQLVPAGELENATYELARTIADNAPLSLAGMKATILRSISLRDTIDHKDLDQLVSNARKSADAQEGVKAMLEKRKPVFRGE
jgi:enoyl-CoA hydratase/carnithine racemase